LWSMGKSTGGEEGILEIWCDVMGWAR
jgi:hypothetical protein